MSRAYSRALNYLTARSRTVKEIADYLARKGFADSEIHDAVSRLQDLGLLDDRRVAKEWVSYCLSCKPLGKDRMEIDLVKRGVDRAIIQEILVSVDEDVEFDQAVKLLAPRPVHQWTRDKLYRFLRYRGFSYSTINRIHAFYENLTHRP